MGGRGGVPLLDSGIPSWAAKFDVIHLGALLFVGLAESCFGYPHGACDVRCDVMHLGALHFVGLAASYFWIPPWGL